MKDVEILSKARYKAMKHMLIAFVLFYCPQIIGSLPGDLHIDKLYQVYIIAPISLVGAIWLFVALIRLMKVQKSINADEMLKQALNNERVVANQSKCFRNAFFATLASIGVALLTTSIYPQVPAMLVCYFVLFVALLSMIISWLTYNKENAGE